VSGMRQDVRAEVEPEGAPRVAALRQKVSLRLLRSHLHQPELHEPAHQEDPPGKSANVLTGCAPPPLGPEVRPYRCQDVLEVS
jgi:hypothetical protein